MSRTFTKIALATTVAVGVGAAAVGTIRSGILSGNSANDQNTSAPALGKIADAARAITNTLTAYPDKLGWLDGNDLTKNDQQRIKDLSAQGFTSNISVIRATQAGYESKITRLDFELLRQDRRRAQAAYPDVSPNALFQSTWLNININAEIPENFCTSHNSEGTMKDGKWYLDGGCYTSIVNSGYSIRADAATTKKYFADLKAKQAALRLDRLKADGPFALEGGSAGSLSVKLDKKTNEVVIIHTQEWSNTGKEWRMLFVAEQWATVNPYDLKAIKAMPSFTIAIERDITVEPNGTKIEIFSSQRPDNNTVYQSTIGTKNIQRLEQ